MLNDHPVADYTKGTPFLASNGNMGGPQVHFINVPSTQDPAAGKQLAHMLLYVSCNVNLNGVSVSINDVFTALSQASERWSQGSPGVPSGTKDYRVVPKDTSQRNMVVRTRALFSPVLGGAGAIDITMATGGNRSNTAPPTSSTKGNLTYYDSALTGDLNKTFGSGTDSDSVTMSWHTLTHEFGHVLGLPDEYGEELDPSTVDPTAKTQDPRVQGYSPPQQGMPTDYRPFYTDGHAMMKANELPRLRHLRHHVEALNADPAFSTVPGRPYVIRHETLGGTGIEYVRPVNEHLHPYVALFSGQAIPGGLGSCALFPTGQDEGVAEAMFVPQGGSPSTLAAASRFDALLIVRSRVRFVFDPSISGAIQLGIIRGQFINQIYDSDHRLAAGVRFALTGSPLYPRIAIVIQPLCACNAAGPATDDFKMTFASATPPPANPFGAGSVGATVNLDLSHFNVFSVLRALLGVPTGSSNTPDVSALKVGDFMNIQKLVDAQLGGTSTVVTI